MVVGVCGGGGLRVWCGSLDEWLGLLRLWYFGWGGGLGWWWCYVFKMGWRCVGPCRERMWRCVGGWGGGWFGVSDLEHTLIIPSFSQSC